MAVFRQTVGPCAYEYDGDLMTKAEGQELDWDLNGNLTGGLAVSMEYNWDNKLRYAQAGDNSIALKYDPEGNFGSVALRHLKQAASIVCPSGEGCLIGRCRCA